jgi:hypothetical protein
MAMVPDSECNTPTLMVSWADAGHATRLDSAKATPAALSAKRRCMLVSPEWEVGKNCKALELRQSLRPQAWHCNRYANACLHFGYNMNKVMQGGAGGPPRAP